MEVLYAGFWRRLAAALIDAALMGIAGLLIILALAHAWHQACYIDWSYFLCGLECLFAVPWQWIFGLCDAFLFGFGVKSVGISFPYSLWYLPGDLLGSYFSLILYTSQLGPHLIPLLALNWLYHAILESSAKQATLGKMLLKIKVTDLNGKRISFWRATARHFSKILSTLSLCIGFLMAGWTNKKQALHDKIAECLVAP